MIEESHQPRRPAAVAFIAIALIASACSSGPASSSPTVAAPSPGATAAATAPSTAAPSVAAQARGSVLGRGAYPAYTVALPSGWSASDAHFVVYHAGAVAGFSVWNVFKVARHPCHWKGQLYDPGPSVDDLVKALVAQPLRNASAPKTVSLAGYTGQSLEWSVPADAVVTGDADFAGCDLQSNGHNDFISWSTPDGGERYQQVAGQVDRLWVLDVNGQRLVADATYSPDISLSVRDELGQIAESLRFVAP